VTGREGYGLHHATSLLAQESLAAGYGVVLATAEIRRYRPGDRVRVSSRSPIGHYRVPMYLRGRTGVVVSTLDRSLIDNEEEGFGRNAGLRGFYYRLSFLMVEIWLSYTGAPQDELRIEMFETWLSKDPT
jgi:ribosomal protein L21E